MTTFDDRVKRFEAEYLHEQELVFKIKARQNRLFAEWGIDQVEMDEAEADDLVQKIINLALVADGSTKAVDLIQELFSRKKVDLSRHRIEKEFFTCFETARDQLSNEV